MNEELTSIAVAAGAPKEVLNEMWFHIFCQKFAHILLTMAEEEIQGD